MHTRTVGGMRTTDNTILITGGTSGIGIGLALRLLEAGNKVIIAGRRKTLLDQIAADHPGIDTIVLDVTDPTSIPGHPDLQRHQGRDPLLQREPARPAG